MRVEHRMPEEIYTSRLRLREPKVIDAIEIFRAYAQDVEVCRYLVWSPHKSDAMTLAFIESCIKAWQIGARMPYVITENNADTPIGMLDAREQSRTCIDIGYVLARTHWGNGYMPEAIRYLAETVLNNSSFFRIQAVCDVENHASQRALEKADFIQEGRLERYLVHPNVSPEPRPCYIYARCR